jgi:hypothetical protein
MKLFKFNDKVKVEAEKESDRPFTRINFILMGVCVLMIILGFLLMSGGGSDDPNVFNPEVFSTRRIVVGPTIAFLGFLLMAFAIIWTPRKKQDKNNSTEK